MSPELTMFGLQAATNLLAGWGKGSATVLARANANSANMIRDANNQRQAAEASLSRYLQSTRNQRVMEAAGRQANAIATNITRVADSFNEANLATRIRASEELGAAAAKAAASGVAGQTQRLVQNAIKLRQFSNEVATKRAQGQRLSDLGASRGEAMLAALGQMDNRHVAAAFDYSVNQVPTGNGFNLLDALSGPGGRLDFTLLSNLKKTTSASSNPDIGTGVDLGFSNIIP